MMMVMLHYDYIFEIINMIPPCILPSGALHTYATIIAYNLKKWVYPSAEQKALDK